MKEPIIKVEQLGKMYALGTKERYYTLRDTLVNIFRKKPPKNKFWALRDINFEIRPSEVLGIIGRNGAGKSTLLKIISQITPPTTGKITLQGRVASLLEIGTGFHPELTGRENIYLNGAILGMTHTEIKQKFNEIVKFAEIDKFLDTPVKRYSSGMYVRLAFAVAAHLESEILLVDEVLAVGDAQFQRKCLNKMGDISHAGRTVIFVSHNMHAIRSLCSRAILLDHGEKVYEGDVGAVINYYENHHTKDIAMINWQNDGPAVPSAQLLKVEVTSDNKQIGPELSTEKQIQIQIVFRNKKAAKIGTSVLIHNQEGQLLFFSLSNHEPSWHMKVRPIGTYRNVCQIPAHLLSPGKYSVSIGLWEGLYEFGTMERDVLCFTTHVEGFIKGDMTYDSNYGLIAPLLTWSSNLEEEDE